MLKKLRSHVQSLVHLPAMKRAVSAKPANDNPCHDDYDILRTLSTGESATVYLVREKNTPRLYVLKVINKLCRDVSTVLNEQAALTRLSGSNFILPLHACFHDTNYWYFLTEYLPGGDLQGLQLLVSLDVEAVRFYMAELLLAIEHVHAHNIIHRDIRQENVFIDTDGHIFLGDFSDAWLFSDCAAETHLTRGRVGTPASSSPEVLFDHEYGFEVDLWAFGVILYKMLTGKEANPTWRRHLSEHIKCDEFFVIVESQLMTEDAADLVSQLLRKDRDSRLSDITEIKKHPFFRAIDWASVASRSLTPPCVPRLVSTRQLGTGYRKPIVLVGDPYTAGDDPLPSFTSRVASSSASSACRRRQQVFGVLEGCAPIIVWYEGSSGMEEVARHPTKRRSL